MKRVIVAIIVLAIAVLVAGVLQAGNGTIIFTYATGGGHYVGHLSYVGLVLLGVPAFLILYCLLRGLLRLRALGAPRSKGGKRADVRFKRPLSHALIDISEGRWEKGERRALAVVNDPELALMGYLIAARAAQMLNAPERRDEYLHKAYDLSKKSRIAVLLTQADLQLAAGQHELALATLNTIQHRKPQHVHALRLLARLHLERGDYTQLHALIPALRKHHALSSERVDKLELDSLVALFRKAAQRSDAARLQKLWQGMARHLRNRAQVRRPYAHALVCAQAHHEAESFIVSQLKNQWDEQLVRLYGLVSTPAPAQALEHAEGWLKQHDYSAALLLTLGRLAIAAELWGKAKSYLEASVHQEKRAETYAVLGWLLDQQGEAEAARKAYSNALDVADMVQH